MPAWLTWVIVIIVVLVVLGLVLAMDRRRRDEKHRVAAAELRQDATGQASGLTESKRQADEARAKADLAEAEAQRAREQAATAEQAHQVDQAGYEDKLRVADQVDPDVNTKSADYQPDVWSDQTTESTDDAHPATTEREGS